MCLCVKLLTFASSVHCVCTQEKYPLVGRNTDELTDAEKEEQKKQLFVKVWLDTTTRGWNQSWSVEWG